MKTVEYKSLGYALPFEAPSSVEEFNTNAWKGATTGEGNPCLDEAINNIIYRGSLAEWRDLFLHGREEDKEKNLTAIKGVEETTGIERNTKPALNAKGEKRVKDGEVVTVYDESQEKYFDRVLSTLVKNGKFASEDLARASFEPFAKQCAAEVKFDASERERSATGPRRLANKYKLTAARIIAANTIDRANKDYLSKIGKTFEPTGDNTKTYTGTYEIIDKVTQKSTGKTAQVEVSDKDAETLGWYLKEYQDWVASQQLLAIAE